MLNDFTVTNAADFDAATDGQLTAILELRQDDSLAEEELCREIVNRVQGFEKEAGLVGLVPDDSDNVYLGFSSQLKAISGIRTKMHRLLT